MKKLFVFLMATLCMTTAFAQVSIGGGGFVTGNFSTWSLDKDQPGSLNRYNASHLSIAPFVFVDLRFVELSLGLPLGWLKADSTMSADPNFPAQTLALRGSAYLKLPFSLSSSITLFPLLGVDYDFYLRARRDDDRDAVFPISNSTSNAKAREALNTLWFKAGIGLDTALTNRLFIRTEFLYGLRLPNKMEKYLKDVRDSETKKMFTHGGDFKIAVGYRLKQ